MSFFDRLFEPVFEGRLTKKMEEAEIRLARKKARDSKELKEIKRGIEEAVNPKSLKQARDQSIIDQIEMDILGTTRTDGFSRYIYNPERRKDWLRITGDEPSLKPHFIYNWRRDVFIEHITPTNKGR